MKKVLVLLTVFIMSVKLAASQELTNFQVDSLPRIDSLYNDMELHDEIRCIAYLFTKNFRVYDSLGNINLNLYYNTDYWFVDKVMLDALSMKIFQTAFKIAIHERVDYFKTIFKELAIHCYDMNGRLIALNYYRIENYSINHATNKSVESFVKLLRVPATSRVVGHELEMNFICTDSSDRSVFHLALLRFFIKAKYLNKKWTLWRGSYISCDGEKRQSQYSLKLKHD
jgi:hypothetical protein